MLIMLPVYETLNSNGNERRPVARSSSSRCLILRASDSTRSNIPDYNDDDNDNNDNNNNNDDDDDDIHIF